MATRLPGLPDPQEETPDALPVQPELQPGIPVTPREEESDAPVQPDLPHDKTKA